MNAIEQAITIVNTYEDEYLNGLYERLKILQECYLKYPAHHLLEEIDEIDAQITRELSRLRPPQKQ